jgi:DNA-binding LacI/PurR family transcriptional regulator
MGVGDEDVQLVKWAAEGMRSRAFDGVVLSDLEINVAAFQNRLRQELPVVTLADAPEEGSLRDENERLRARGGVSAVV